MEQTIPCCMVCEYMSFQVSLLLRGFLRDQTIHTGYSLFKHFAIALTPAITHIINLTVTLGNGIIRYSTV